MEKTLFIIADSWHQNTLINGLEVGLFPELEEMLAYGSHLYKNIFSVFPSASLPAHATLLTGAHPYQHQIPGHRYFNRITQQYVDYIGPGIRTVNTHLSDRVKTIHELTDNSYSIMSPICRGVTRSLFLPTFSSKIILKHAVRILKNKEAKKVVAWLPKGDKVGHLHGPQSKQLIKEMHDVIKAIYNIKNHAAKQNGIKIYMASDHGHKMVGRRVNLIKILNNVCHKFSMNRKPRNYDDALVCSVGDSTACLYFISKYGQSNSYYILQNIIKNEDIQLIFWKKIMTRTF